MLEEQYSDLGEHVPVIGAESPAAGSAAGAALASAVALSAPIVPPALRMEGVPSEQLWRAAVLAARQAALAAADLRRALAESAAGTIVQTSDDAASRSLVS